MLLKLTRICQTAVFLALVAAGASGVQAEQSLLASQDLQLAQGLATAELWGDVLPGGYARNLLVLFHTASGRLLTAYSPDIPGGYTPYLEKARLYPGAYDQLLLSVPQGSWREKRQVRLLECDALGNVTELLTAADNLGVVQSVGLDSGGTELSLVLRSGQGTSARLQNQAQAGDSYRLNFGGFNNVSALDLDGDGVDELLTLQEIEAGLAPLAQVGALWRYEVNPREADSENALALEANPDAALVVSAEEPQHWRQSHYTVMTSAKTDKNNHVNDGVKTAAYSVLPRAMLLPGAEATLPYLVVPREAALQNQLNALLAASLKPYIEGFIKNGDDCGFQVLTHAEKVLSIEIISGKEKLERHYLNLNPLEGRSLELNDIVKTEKPALYRLLQALNSNKAVNFRKMRPGAWYIVGGDKLFLVTQVAEHQEVSGFLLGNLKKYLQPWILEANSKK